MEYKLYSNITCANLTESYAKNIGEGLLYQEMYSAKDITHLKNWRIRITR